MPDYTLLAKLDELNKTLDEINKTPQLAEEISKFQNMLKTVSLNLIVCAVVNFLSTSVLVIVLLKGLLK